MYRTRARAWRSREREGEDRAVRRERRTAAAVAAPSPTPLSGDRLRRRVGMDRPDRRPNRALVITFSALLIGCLCGDGAAACHPAPEADPRCCNLTSVPEYSSLFDQILLDLDMADYSMSIAAGIDCCDGDDKAPCRACIQGMSPHDRINTTQAAESARGVNRLVGVLRRLRCFGGDISGGGPYGASQALGSEASDLQYVANGGCACAWCPAPKCSSGGDGDWLLYALPVAAALIVLAGGAACWHRRRRLRGAASSAQSDGGIQRTLLV
eukprot:COSAG06_NODE_2508_length_6744_cov_2.590642_2_plen_269_part_00